MAFCAIAPPARPEARAAAVNQLRRKKLNAEFGWQSPCARKQMGIDRETFSRSTTVISQRRGDIPPLPMRCVSQMLRANRLTAARVVNAQPELTANDPQHFVTLLGHVRGRRDRLEVEADEWLRVRCPHVEVPIRVVH